MKQSINTFEFVAKMERIRPDNFTYEGLKALSEYFEEYEESTGEEIEFDPIAICCEYTEDSIKNVLSNYDLDTLEELEDNTQVIHVGDENIIYASY